MESLADATARQRADDKYGPPSGAHKHMMTAPFLIGLAFPSMQGAWTFSTVESSTTWKWPYLLELAQQADAGGFDYLFLGSQYFPPRGFGGLHRTHALEALTLTGAIAAVTSNVFIIGTFSTIGEANPLLFSRMVATLDHISNGRIGVNVMANPAFGDFGGRFASLDSHEGRYRAADEFVTIAKRLWSEEEYIFSRGEFFDVQSGYISPKPIQPHPLLMTADLIPASVEFAAKHCDLVFLSRDSRPQVLKDAALIARGNERGGLRTLGMLYVIARETEREAQEFAEHLKATVEPSAMAGYLRKFARTESERNAIPVQMVFAGDRAYAPAIGTPEQIVEHFVKLHRAGVDGVQMVFCDYRSELTYFRDRVMPLLREAGLKSN